MPILYAFLVAMPVAAYVTLRWQRRGSDAWYWPWLRAAMVLALGFACASPFVTNRELGTGEAYNYDLAVADGVTQVRAGLLPVLVGQTEYAWNGRIHPLRTAPGLIYATALLDTLTGRRLGFWTLQNLVLAAALAAAVFLLYGGLRRWLHAAPDPALVVTAAFAMGPGLLAPAYTGDLYMTVLVAPFAVLVVLINLRSVFRTARSDPWLLAGGLGGAWWAHPPVAAWLTVITAGFQVIGLLCGPDRLARLGRLTILVAAGGVLAAYPFVSVLTIISHGALNQNYAATILRQIYGGGLGALLPVGRQIQSVSDYQLGYLLWLLLAATAWRILRAPSTVTWRERVAGSAALLAALVLLALVLPVPHLTSALWHLLPLSLGMITNVWPMQRLYLIGSVLVAAAAGLVWTRCPPVSPRGRSLALAVVTVGLAWSAVEAGFFVVSRGFNTWRGPAETARGLRRDNIDLTVTSYSFLGTPDDFHYGPMAPWIEARLLRAGHREVTGNWQAAQHEAGTVVAQGTLVVAQVDNPTEFRLKPRLKLEPGRHYVLSLPGAAPRAGALEIQGPDYLRRYSLEDRLGAHGFGLLPGNRPALALSNSRDRPVTVDLVVAPDAAPGWAPGSPFAQFVLRKVDMRRLPVQLTSFLPLTYRVHSPEEGCCLETIRRYVPGYVATVDGRPVRAFRSPDGNVMIPVPKGDSTVIVRHPGVFLVRAAFWVSLAAGLLIVGIIVAHATGFDRTFRRQVLRPTLGAAAWPFRTWLRGGTVVSISALVIVSAVAWRRHATRLHAVGPLRIRVFLPTGLNGRHQPILTTGRNGAGAVVYVSYVDDSHIQVGADIWGGGAMSKVLPVNYFHEQDFVIDSSALYPPDNPAVRALNPLARQVLLHRLRVELNGHLVLEMPRSAFPSTLDEITVGRNQIGASTADSVFTGTIASVRRLPVAPPLILAPGAALRLRVRFPAVAAGADPLCAVGPDGRDGLCYVHYLPHGKIQFAHVRPGGTVVTSDPMAALRGRAHTIRIQLGPAAADRPGPVMTVAYDGRAVLGPPSLATDNHPHLVTAGMNVGGVRGVAERFSGPAFDVRPPAPGSAGTAAASTGPCRMIVLFPTGMTGQAEPILVTGRTGSGDATYVIYEDASHVRFGFDYSGRGGAISQPVPLDYATPHILEVSMGSLYPPLAETTAWKSMPPARRSRLKQTRWIRLDGRMVFKADLPCHPTTPEEISPGKNHIALSTCRPQFSGVIYSVTRAGLSP